MVDFSKPTGGPGDGVFPTQLVLTCTNRAGATLAEGSHAMLNLEGNATEVDNFTPGSADADGNNSAFNNVVDPLDTGQELKYGIFCIAMEDVADNTAGKFLFRGKYDTANVDGATAAGSALHPAADNQLDVIGTGGDKIIGIALEADASNVAAILFDGINGFGQAPEA